MYHQTAYNKSYSGLQCLVKHRCIHKGEDQYTCSYDGCPDELCCTTSTVDDQYPQRDLSADVMEKSPRDSTQAAMSVPVYAVPTELPTPQDVGFFSGPGQHKYQFNMQVVGSPDSQQYVMTQPSQLIQRTSSAAELGDPGATSLSTNLQSSTVRAVVLNHGIVTPGQSPASYGGFIDEDIVSLLMLSDTWNTYSDFALPSQLLPPQSPPRPQTNPFDDCSGLFGHDSPLPKFPRPADGEVNSYVKFNWPRPPLQRQCPAPQASTSTLLAGSSSTYRRSSNLPPSQIGASLPSPARSFRSCYQNDITTVPQLLLPPFGHNARMDSTDRKLFEFYTHNWCPGRSLLKKTNPWWLFASMLCIPSVRMAMQSLAGVYVHDYMPLDAIRHRANEGFAFAVARLSELLQDMHDLSDSESSELVTLMSLLCVQDVILTERRLPNPYPPRWLMGFRKAEEVLRLTDPESNVQVSALRVSQSVIVARAVILAQVMMPLPQPATFDFTAGSRRFMFLLHESGADMLEVHGGCGFSKRLLHIFSQVADCSTRMLQDGETPIVPVTAEMLYEQLVQMCQWSRECENWSPTKSRHQPIEWIRQTDKSYVIQEAKQMIDVTAEAWRLAGIVYLQCRLLRLPRNNHMVISIIADLAKCVSIMPTSGVTFTANAPLLPVFLLGLLATVEEHVRVANAWFEQVIRTPVRSSVPPLYEALNRIQSWMDREVPVPAPTVESPCTIAERYPWWELMVHHVQKREGEVFCVT